MFNLVTVAMIGAAAAPAAESSEGSGWILGALLLAGTVLLLVETILPGMIAGILGGVCLLSAVVVGYTSYGAGVGNLILTGVIIGLTIGTACWLKYFPKSRVAHAFISHSAVGELEVEKPELLHQSGLAQSDLRPSGVALINGHRVDVVAESGLIAQGTPVKVISVEGAKVIVRAVA